MAWVETRITRTSQPQDAVGIDWNNPITRGLAGAVGVGHGTSIPVLTGAPEYAATPSGMAYHWIDGANASARVTTARFTGSAYTTLTVFTPRALGAGFKKLGGWLTDAGNGGAFFNWDHENPAYARAVELWAGGVTAVLKYPDPTLGRRTVWAAVVSGTSLLGYADGNLAGSATLTGTPSGWTTLSNGAAGDPTGAVDGMLTLAFNRALSDAEIRSISENPWQIFEPEVSRIWVDDYVSAGGGATVIPIGVQATGSVGTPSVTGAANALPAGVSATASVGTPVAVGGASIAATALPVGVAASSAVGAPIAIGAAVAKPAGVSASSAVGVPVAIAGTSIPATVLPTGVQAFGAVGTPTVTAAAIAQPLGVAAIAYVGTPTIATGVSGVAVAYPAGVQAIGQVGALIATGAAWTAAVGVQAVASVGTPSAYAGIQVIYTPGAQTRPSRIQSSSRPSRLQTGTRASR